MTINERDKFNSWVDNKGHYLRRVLNNMYRNIGDADKHTYRLFIEAPMTLDDTHQMLLDAIHRGDFVDRTDVILPIIYDDVL